MKKTTSLSAMQPRSVPRLQQLALMRLQLRFTAETHKLYRALYRDLVKLVKAAVDDEGVVDGVKVQTSMGTVDARWAAMHGRWVAMVERAGQWGADIPWGALIGMRKGMVGLAMLVQQGLSEDPFSGALYAFRGRRAGLIKLLWHDGIGLCMLTKKLEQGQFAWPSTTATGRIALSPAQLTALLDGCEWRAPPARHRSELVG